MAAWATARLRATAPPTPQYMIQAGPILSTTRHKQASQCTSFHGGAIARELSIQIPRNEGLKRFSGTRRRTLRAAHLAGLEPRLTSDVECSDRVHLAFTSGEGCRERLFFSTRIVACRFLALECTFDERIG